LISSENVDVHLYQWFITFTTRGPPFQKNIRWTTSICWHLMNN